MRLRILAVGTRMPGWVETGFAEYHKRMPPEIRVELQEIPPGPRGKGQDVARAVQRESEALLKAVGNDRVIALEVKGKPWSTPQLAGRLWDWQLSGDHWCLLIGGPDGLSDECRSRAEVQWSLSPLTLPHPLVRIMVMEQLYRAWSINAGHPYHR